MIASHSGATLLLWPLLGGAWAVRAEPLVNGSAGVQVFFVLSGFLITRLLRDEMRRTGTVGLRRFYARRMLRLAPPFAVFLAVVGGLVAAGALAPEHGQGLLLSAVYAYNFVARGADSVVLTSTWSLAIEEQFYLVLPALLLAARSRPALALAALAVLLAALGLTLEATPLAERFFLGRWPTAVFPTLFAGCLAALAWERRHVPRRWAPWLVVAVVAYGVSLWAPEPNSTLAYLVRTVGIAIGVLWTVAHPASRTVRVLEWAPLRWVGRLSYSLYLWQSLLLTTGPRIWTETYAFEASVAANVARAAREGLMPLLWLPPFNLLVLLGLAVASYYGVERPSLRWRARVAGRRQAAAPSVASRP